MNTGPVPSHSSSSRPPGQVGRQVGRRTAGQHACHADRSGTCAAGQRDAAAPLPGPHPDVTGGEHLHEVDVHPLGKRGVPLDLWADHLERHALDIRQ